MSSPRRRSIARFVALVTLHVAVASACGGGSGDDGPSGGCSPADPACPRVVSVSVEPVEVQLAAGDTRQLLARVESQGGASSTVEWSTSSPAVVTVTGAATGALITAVAPGQARVTATSTFDRSRAASVDVTVSSVGVASVLIESPGNVTSVRAEETLQLRASLRDASGSELAGRAVTWASTATAVATIDGQGLVTAVAPGITQVSATSEGKLGAITITVTPAMVASVIVTPARDTLRPGESVALVAEARSARGAVLAGRAVTWHSADGARLTVSAGGVLTAIAPASAPVTVTATVDGVTGTGSYDVLPPRASAVRVTINASALRVGQVTQATAAAVDASGAPLAGRSYTWRSSDPAIASVSSAGVVTAVAAGGPVAIVAAESVDGVEGSASLDVTAASVASVTVAPTVTTVAEGFTTRLVATARDGSGTVLGATTFAWTTSDATVATVAADGTVAGVSVSAAPVTITATAQGVSGGAVVTVVAPGPPIRLAGVRAAEGHQSLPLQSLRDSIEFVVELGPSLVDPRRIDVMLDGHIATTRLLGADEGSAAAYGVGLNTAGYTLSDAQGIALPRFRNRSYALRARVTYADGGTRETGDVTIALTNPDAFVGVVVPPAIFADDASGRRWYGGPSGVLVLKAYPLEFGSGPGRIESVTMRFGSAPPVTVAGPPFIAALGLSSAPGLLGYVTPPAGASMLIVASRYQGPAPGPVRFVRNGEPAPIRVDYAPPEGGALTLVLAPPATDRWVNAFHDFATGYTPPTDQGVGLPSPRNPAWRYSGCDVPVLTPFDGRASSLRECPADFTNDAWHAVVQQSDRLGNQAVIPLDGRFGVDFNPPLARMSATASGYRALGSPVFQVEGFDDRSGVSPDMVRQFVARQGAAGLSCVLAGNPAGTFANPSCPERSEQSGLSLPGGWVRARNPLPFDLPGFYAYRGRVADRAGNFSPIVIWEAWEDQLAPQIRNATLPRPLRAGQPARADITDDLEIAFTSFTFLYPALGAHASPCRVGAGKAWDDTVIAVRATTCTMDTFYRHVEVVGANGVPVASPTGTKPTVMRIEASDLAGRLSLEDVPVPPDSVEAGIPFASVAGPARLLAFRQDGRTIRAETSDANTASPLVRVDVYERVGTALFLVGAVTSATASDAGGVRGFTYTFPATVLAGRTYVAIGVTAASDAIATAPFVSP